MNLSRLLSSQAAKCLSDLLESQFATRMWRLGALRSALIFLHLSDIHFRRKAGEIYDPFLGLRNELELDLKKVSSDHFEKITAILITGDVAYSGHPEEYAFATAWIEKIAKSIGLDPEADVYLIPGNHDVVRNVVAESPTIQGYHATLRSPSKDVNESLRAYLEKDGLEEIASVPIGTEALTGTASLFPFLSAQHLVSQGTTAKNAAKKVVAQFFLKTGNAASNVASLQYYRELLALRILQLKV